MAAHTGLAVRYPRWQLGGLTVVPLLTLVLVFSNEQHGLIWRQVEIQTNDGLAMWKALHGPWFWVISAYSYLVLAAATLLIVRQTRKDAAFFQTRGTLLLVGMLIPWAVNAIYLF